MIVVITISSKLHRGGSDWTPGGISLVGVWSMPQVCQCSRGVCTVLLITGFDFWSSLKWSGGWIR